MMEKKEIQMRIVLAVIDDLISLREGSGDEVGLLYDRCNIFRDEKMFKRYKKQIIGILTDEEEGGTRQ